MARPGGLRTSDVAARLRAHRVVLAEKGNWRGTQRLPASYFDSYMKPLVPDNLPRTAGGINDYLDIGTTGGATNQNFPGQESTATTGGSIQTG